MIACSVARHNLCARCGAASHSHDQHDRIFGGKKVYVVCLLIWVVSFLTILPEALEVCYVVGSYQYCKIFLNSYRKVALLVGLILLLDVTLFAKILDA